MSSRSALYEYEPRQGVGRIKLDKKTWLSWSGRRWLNGVEYHGPVFVLGTNTPVKRQARVCLCDDCQRTDPDRVDSEES